MDKKEEAAASASKTSMGIDLGTTNSCVSVRVKGAAASGVTAPRLSARPPPAFPPSLLLLRRRLLLLLLLEPILLPFPRLPPSLPVPL